MATNATVPILPDLTAFKEARIERYCQLAAATFLVFEYLITWSDEVELFWKKRWTFGKCVFLWSRYYSLIFNIGNATVFLQADASLELCSKFFHWQNTGASLQVVTTHIILELRLYAMYESSKKILALFICMTLSEAAIMGVFVGVPVPGLRGTNNPSPGLFICADGDPVGGHWVAFYWTSLITFESILLSLSLIKAYKYHKTGRGGSIMRLLTRDSVLYFLFIFGIYVGNQVIWLINDITLNEVGTGFSFCISAVLANRLMFAVRSSYFRPVERYAGHSTRGSLWPSGRPPPSNLRNKLSRMSANPQPVFLTQTEEDEEFEMKTFNERLGI